MRPFPILTPILALCAAPVLADDCADLARHLIATPPTEHGPYIVDAAGTMGGMATVTRQHVIEDQHMLAETIEPKGMHDVLHYKGGAYAPEVEGWRLLYQSDAAAMQEQSTQGRQEQADAILTATCSDDDMDGQTLTRVEAQLGPVQVFEKGMTYMFWVTPDENRRIRMDMDYELNGMPTKVRFDFTWVPDLTLPSP